MMELRTTSPPRLITPMNAVKPNGLCVTNRPSAAPGNAKGNAAITINAIGQRAELQQQDEEDQHQADCQRSAHLAKGFTLVFIFAAILDAIPLWQLQVIDLLFDIGQDLAGKPASIREGAYRQSADTVAAHNPARMPLRRDRCDRTVWELEHRLPAKACKYRKYSESSDAGRHPDEG